MRRIYKPNTKEGDIIAEKINIDEARKFTVSDVFRTPDNMNRYQDEVKRYGVIADYFWVNAVSRLRESEMNIKYIEETKSRLSEIKEIPGLPWETRLSCSEPIEKIKKSFGPK